MCVSGVYLCGHNQTLNSVTTVVGTLLIGLNENLDYQSDFVTQPDGDDTDWELIIR